MGSVCASPKNILFIAYEFPPRGESGVQRSAKFAKYLPDFGYRPLVLSGAEEEIDAQPTHVDASLMRDVERVTVFPCRGSESLWVRVPERIELLRRLLKFCIPPDLNRVAWLPHAKRMALRIAKRHPIHAIYTSVGPFSTGLLGLELKKALGVPWIVDFRDPWADSCSRFWSTRLHYRIEANQERRVVEGADAVVVVTPMMRESMVRRYPHCAQKIHLICNGFDREDFLGRNGSPPTSYLQIAHTGKMIDFVRRAVRGSWGPLSRFWFSHVAFRHAQVDFSTHSPYYLLRAVRALLDERPDLHDKIRLVFAGIVGRRNLQVARELRLEGVVSDLGYLSHNQSVQLLFDSDVLFLPLMSWTDGRPSYIYTGKVFEYLATGRPILAAVPPGDVRDLIRDVRAGWCVDPYDVGAIKNLLAELVERKHQGRLGVRRADEIIARFERRELTRQLAQLFDRIAAPDGSITALDGSAEAVSSRRGP